MKGLFRWWRPKSDWASLAGLADGLSAAVDQAEMQVQQELRAGQGALMPVRFTAAAHPQLEAGIDSAEVDEISTYFDLLEQPRRLVVLGDPGAGKTVAATYLVRSLIQRRSELLAVTRRAAEPVPVRVNTAGWDGGQEFSTWLVTRLGVDYQLRAHVAEKMVKSGMILPILDGLDEMDDDTTSGKRARALLDRLNEREWAHRPAVVLCRSTEFDHLAQAGGDNGLHGAATVILDPLTTNQPADYLTRYQHRINAKHPAWNRITTHLRQHPDTPLAVTLRNPWMLGLIATALHRTPQTTTALLDCTTPGAVRDGLFAAQIPAAIAGTDDNKQFRDYTSDNVEKWLHTLARHLEHRRASGHNGTAIRLDEIWEIAGTTRIRLLHGLALALLVGLIYGLTGWFVFELMVGFTGGLAYESANRLIVGLIVGLPVGLAFGLTAGLARFPRAARIAWKVPTRTRWPRGLAFGLAGMFIGVILGGLTAGVPAGLPAGLTAGLTVGPIFWLMFGLMFGLETEADDQLALGTDARHLIRNDLQAALLYGAMGLLFGLAAGIAFSLGAKLAVGLAAGLAFGLMFGLPITLLRVLVSGRFFLAVLLFKITGVFPGRPAVLLDWARDSGLLRVNATAYQFRHQTYQQWLLHHSRVSDSPRSPDDVSPVPTAS
ncbi:NACHT domain-containing protein [Nocardia sp. NPDC058176]|uniref:NACHT domain-containing protein n=1 Tax=Nocardia sp. NPDC058176 TaxID=3346368 RepID=UPI0036D8FBE0